MSFTESLDAIVAENRNQLLSKHDSWERVRLGDIVRILNGFPFESAQFSSHDDGIPLIRIRDIVRGTTATSYVGEYLLEFLIEPDDLLIGMDGDFNCAFWRGEPGLLNQRCGKLSVVSECFDRRFLAYCLPGYLAAINAHTSSVTVKHLSSLTVADIPLPLPPEREQVRIADALDELLSGLDAGVRALESVRAKLRQYRAAVLKAGVEGALTAEWRNAHPDVEPASELLKRILADRRRRWEEAQLKKHKDAGKEPPKNWKARYREPEIRELGKLATLPDGWRWATLDQLGRLDRGRSQHRPRDAAFLYGGPYPFLQTGDVRKAKQYIREHVQTYSEAGLRQSRLWPPETLCITIAANIAETALLSYPACFPDSVVGVIFPDSLVLPRFVEFFLRHAKGRIAAYAPATAQKNINNEILRDVAVSLPPRLEQEAFVEVLEDHMSVIDHLESDLEAKLKSAQALRQSILKAAFEGRLVPQDSNDEPASELLKRIAGERAERERLTKQAKKPARTAKVRRSKRRQNENAASTA